jgi:hypothetical protein
MITVRIADCGFYSGFQVDEQIQGWRSLWSAPSLHACNRFGSPLLHSLLTGQLSNSSTG